MEEFGNIQTTAVDVLTFHIAMHELKEVELYIFACTNEWTLCKIINFKGAGGPMFKTLNGLMNGPYAKN